MTVIDTANIIIEPRPERAARRRLISVCTPMFNEAENIEPCYRAVREFFETRAPGYDWEWVVTDNHSTDGSFERLRTLAAMDARVRGYRFSRNFGYQRSILAGYLRARGDAAVQLDCDLEDPPALIVEFLKLWEAGNQVAYGIRRSRQEPGIVQLARRVFYWGLDKISQDPLPRDVGDFRLIDRRIIDELRSVRDPHLYIRGRIATMGFKQAGVAYDRSPRLRGVTKFNIWRLVGLALDATLSHSVVPLRIATFMGLALCLATVLLIAGYAGARLFWESQWPAGFTTTVVLILFGMGINGLFLGIIGEYLARIYQHLKGSEGVIVMEEVGTRARARAAGLTRLRIGLVEHRRRSSRHRHRAMDASEDNSRVPIWWDWDLELTWHLIKRMQIRAFNEVDLRTMLQTVHRIVPDHEPGRWKASATHHGRSWEVILEPDFESRIVRVITAYPLGISA